MWKHCFCINLFSVILSCHEINSHENIWLVLLIRTNLIGRLMTVTWKYNRFFIASTCLIRKAMFLVLKTWRHWERYSPCYENILQFFRQARSASLGSKSYFRNNVFRGRPTGKHNLGPRAFAVRRWEIACAVRHNRTQPLLQYGCVALRMQFFFPKFWNDETNFTRVFVTVSPRRPWDRGCRETLIENITFPQQSVLVCPELNTIYIFINNLINLLITIKEYGDTRFW